MPSLNKDLEKRNVFQSKVKDVLKRENACTRVIYFKNHLLI